jgi:hypothetical protein
MPGGGKRYDIRFFVEGICFGDWFPLMPIIEIQVE